MKGSVIGAIVRRELRSWLGNPAGYVFICVFTFACAAFLLREAFFTRNVASLDTLSEWFPYLLVFLIPAITMGTWAGERSTGTDELLLTLPARESQIVLGKYLACVAIMSVVLLFTFPLVIILGLLGAPDWGTLLSTYLAWWLLSAVLIGAGMAASQLSDNLTVAFIIGAVFCGLLVGAEAIMGHFAPGLLGSAGSYLPVAQFQKMTHGLVSLSGIALFVGLIIAFYYANLVLVTRRHQRVGDGAHRWVRFACLAVMAVAVAIALGYWGGRIDATADRIHSLSDHSTEIVAELERPVVIEAFVSPLDDTPKDFIQTRRDLLNVLREFDNVGGDKTMVRIVETKRHSEEAKTANDKFGIRPRSVVVQDDQGVRQEELFLGAACTSGPEQVITPFFFRKMSPEYELARSIKTVAEGERRKLGILATELELMGGFDRQTFTPIDPWMIVQELEQQYDVVGVQPGSDYPDDLDVLLAPMASSLTQEHLDRLAEYTRAGNPVLFVDDPLPLASPRLAASEPKGGPQNPMMRQQQPEPKGDFAAFFRSIGIAWSSFDLAWDSKNPHPELIDLPNYYVFVGAGAGGISESDEVTSGLQEVVVMAGGVLGDAEEPDIAFTPLITTSGLSGTISYRDLVRTSMFGQRQIDEDAPRLRDPEQVLACRVRGKDEGESKGVNAIFIADVDFMSDGIYRLRQMVRPKSAAGSDFNFDNITVILNAVDELAGDERFIHLRKRRPAHRTLTRIEEETLEFEETFLARRDEVEKLADKALVDANKRFEEAVKQVEQSVDLDDREKSIRIQSIETAERRRLDVAQAKIEAEKEQEVELAYAERVRRVRSIKDFYKRMGWMISPLLGVGVGLLVLFIKRQREQESIPQARRKGGAA